MAQDDRDLLDVLTFELKFLEDGGYGRSPRTPWLRQRAFEDSITCPNFGDPSHPHPCSECLLMQFVPGELKDQDSPCRLIPLNDKGETIDYLFRCGTQLELEEALAGWLRKQISQIEQERKVAAGAKPSGNDPNGMDEIARKRWLALVGNLNYLANRHRDSGDYLVAHSLYGRALAAAEKIAMLGEAERSQAARIRESQEAVAELLRVANEIRQQAPAEAIQTIVR